MLGGGQFDDLFRRRERFKSRKVNLPDSQTLGGFDLVPVENFNNKFGTISRSLYYSSVRILPGYGVKTYDSNFEMFIPIWRSGLLPCLRFEDLVSVELEDSEGIGFSYKMSIIRQVGHRHRTNLLYQHPEFHDHPRLQLVEYPGLRHPRQDVIR